MSAHVLWYLGIGYPSPCKRHVHPEFARMGLSVIATNTHPSGTGFSPSFPPPTGFTALRMHQPGFRA